MAVFAPKLVAADPAQESLVNVRAARCGRVGSRNLTGRSRRGCRSGVYSDAVFRNIIDEDVSRVLGGSVICEI